MKLHTAALTDIGSRKNNQDRFIQNDKLKLFAVADGMGGHAGGEIAAQMAVDSLEDYPNITSLSALIQGVKEANLNIFKEASKNISLKGMGTTVTALYLSKDTAYVAHVGDSRLYLIREGFIWQLSEDHTLLLEQALTHTLKNVITRSVGYEKELKIDVYTKKILPGDGYLLCTDGLYNFVKNREIAEIVSSFPPDTALKKLIALANSRKGDDNITAVLVKVVDEGGMI